MSIQRQLTNERMSQIVTHNGTVYLAGQVGDDMNAGSVTIYLKDIDAHFEGMNSVWDQWLPKGATPARATVEAKLCEPEILVELSVVAALP